MPNSQNHCPICGAPITMPENTEESEIISCPECANRIVVARIVNNQIVLEEAPKVEEDWGE
ncbi:MAG: lysine biosynthesis protein LysW [Candidatus Magasanikbacteria bacterium]|nr:lysine biosynthesis protein LysW [Candidatus Magasanikbacteria bacterium]